MNPTANTYPTNPSPCPTDTSDTSDMSDTSDPEDLTVPWVNLETVVAYYSTRKSVYENFKKAVTYTGILLAARPDRVAVLGLSIGAHPCGCRLCVSH